MSDSAMARELGVSPQRIGWWRRRLRERATPSDPAFMEVKVTGYHAQGRPFAVHTRNGRVVAVWPGFDGDELGRLLAVVEDAPC